MKKIILFAIFCGCQEPCYFNHYANVTDYPASPDAQTPEGIAVRTNGQEVDLEKIDALTDYVESCLGIPVNRDCLKVVVPNDWFLSCNKQNGEFQQVFPCRINPQVCADKGLIINPDCVPGQLPNEICPCPCSCRATIQDENVVITAPNLYLYSAELIRMVTGVNNIWTNEETVICYTNPNDL
jgi:hypothetical protein